MHTTETALEKLEKLLDAELKTYCAKAGPDATAEWFEQHVTPLIVGDPELLRAATRRLITAILDEEPEAQVVAKSDEELMKFLQSRSFDESGW
jgi:hypothetical protein